MSRPYSPRNSSPTAFVRVNGKIRAREVRVIGVEGNQLGVMPLTDAINLARHHAVDLVEIAATAVPPVCRLVDFGKYRYEIAKKEKESKKHQHASGYTMHACTNKEGKVRRIPQILLDLKVKYNIKGE